MEYEKIISLISNQAAKNESTKQLFGQLNKELQEHEQLQLNEKLYLAEISRLNFQVESYRLLLARVSEDAAERANEHQLAEQSYSAVMRLIHIISNLKLENIARYSALKAEIQYKEVFLVTSARHKTIYENKRKLEGRKIVQEYRRCVAEKQVMEDEFRKLKAYDKSQVADVLNEFNDWNTESVQCLDDISKKFDELEAYRKKQAESNSDKLSVPGAFKLVPNKPKTANTFDIVMPTESSFFNFASSLRLRRPLDELVANAKDGTDAAKEEPIDQLSVIDEAALGNFEALSKKVNVSRITPTRRQPTAFAPEKTEIAEFEKARCVPSAMRQADKAEEGGGRKVHFNMHAETSCTPPKQSAPDVGERDGNDKVEILENILLPSYSIFSQTNHPSRERSGIDEKVNYQPSTSKRSDTKEQQPPPQPSCSSVKEEGAAATKPNKESESASKEMTEIHSKAMSHFDDFFLQPKAKKSTAPANTNDFFQLNDEVDTSSSQIDVDFSPPFERGSFGLQWFESGDGDQKSYEL